jgi:hypothetical protein
MARNPDIWARLWGGPRKREWCRKLSFCRRESPLKEGLPLNPRPMPFLRLGCVQASRSILAHALRLCCVQVTINLDAEAVDYFLQQRIGSVFRECTGLSKVRGIMDFEITRAGMSLVAIRPVSEQALDFALEAFADAQTLDGVLCR